MIFEKRGFARVSFFFNIKSHCERIYINELVRK